MKRMLVVITLLFSLAAGYGAFAAADSLPLNKTAERTATQKAVRKAAISKTAEKTAAQKAVRKAAINKTAEKTATQKAVRKAAISKTAERTAAQKAVRKAAISKTAERTAAQKAVRKAAISKTAEKTATQKAVRKADKAAPKKAPAKKTAAKKKSSPKKQHKSGGANVAVQSLNNHLSMLQEVWLRHITLEYLGDKRTEPFLAKILEGFSKKLKQNFIENIKGDYKAEFFANYADKTEDLNRQIISVVQSHPKYDSPIASLIKSCEFPMNLAYASLVKDLSALRKQQSAENPKIAEWAKYWQGLSAQLKSEAKKSRYEAVAAMYKDTEPMSFPISWYDDAQYAVAFETEGAQPASEGPQQRKKWTILAYVCADNDLERFGLQDVNEMEQVGSSKDVNLIAQIDRLAGGRGDVITDGNWVGTRRYYVTRDSDPNKISSKMVANMGELDMGAKQTLADYLKWGVKNYPADNYIVVIWNHGAGWVGIALDEESGHMLSMNDVSWALGEGQKELCKLNGAGSKFAIVDFDACLMGTVEVGYELAPYVSYMVASEETEPGQGMPYADYLEPLVRNPHLTPREMTKRMVGTYVYSYSKGGSATNRYIKGSTVTKSSTDLEKLSILVRKLDELASALLSKHDVYSGLLVDQSGLFASIRRYSDETLVDIVDFCSKLAQMSELPSDMRQTCIDIIKLIGYPVANEKLAKPVIITSEKPGSVVWGYNGWRMPPQELWPSNTRIYNSRLAITPLKKLQGGGYYLQIGPFKPVQDQALEKIVFVDQINYQIFRDDGKVLDKRNIKQGKEYLIVSKFPIASPMVIEGHTQGMGDSHGLSVYYPPAYSFDNKYKSLRFAKETSWDEFIESIPEFKRNADVLLCGQMVQDPMTLPLVAQALKANGAKFQVLWDPSVYAFDFKDILAKYAVKNGVVITDGVSASSMGQLTPSSDDLLAYMNKGGRLMVAAQSFGKSNIHRKLLKNFGYTFVEAEKDFDELICKSGDGEFTFNLNGSESSKTADDVTIMKSSKGDVFITMPDKRGAAICVSEPKNRGVYLGFRFEAVGDTEARNRLMGEILDRLVPEKKAERLY